MKKALLILTLLSSNVWAGSDTGADFLKIPVSARAIATGQAFTAARGAADSLQWNVAGIVTPDVGALALSHQQLFDDNSLDQAGVVMPNPQGRATTWGFSLMRLSYADQEQRDANREKTGSFSASDMSAGLALARRVGSMSLGTQLKMIRMDLAGEKANGFALDLGMQTPSPYSRLSLGMAVKNLGPRMKFIDEEFHLPLTISAGGILQLFDPFSIAFDVQSRPHQNQVVLAVGAEYMAANMLTLRAGYLNRVAQAVTNTQESESNRGNFAGLNGVTSGLGFKLGSFSIDYAMMPFGELGQTHNFTLTSYFGGAKSTPAAQPAAVPERPAEKLPTQFNAPDASDDWWKEK